MFYASFTYFLLASLRMFYATFTQVQYSRCASFMQLLRMFYACLRMFYACLRMFMHVYASFTQLLCNLSTISNFSKFIIHRNSQSYNYQQNFCRCVSMKPTPILTTRINLGVIESQIIKWNQTITLKLFINHQINYQCLILPSSQRTRATSATKWRELGIPY